MVQHGKVLVKMKSLKKNKSLIFLVSQEWQVENYILLIEKFKNEEIEILFLCSDLITKGNSYKHLKKINKYSFELIPNGNGNRIIFSIKTTSFIVNLIKNKYKLPFKNITFITDNFSNIFVSALRNIKFLFNSKLFILQHGENYFNYQDFNYLNGWHNNKKIKPFFSKKILIDFFLLTLVSIIYLKPLSFIKIKNRIINYKFDYLSFADKIMVSNQENKKCLIDYGINQNIIHVVGSILVDKLLFNFNPSYELKISNYKSVVIYSSGTYRKSLKLTDRFNQKLFFTNISKVFKKLNLTCYFKLKPDEEFYFKKDHPQSNFFTNNSEFKNYLHNNTNILHILPIDSTLCLEFSLSKIPFITFSSWDSMSSIAKLNYHSGVEILKYNMNQDELFRVVRMILNFEINLKFIKRNDLESLLGSLNESYNEKIYNLIN
jgi:hypothetical protein